jgi:integrase
MLRTKRLNDDGVANLKPSKKRVTIPDPELRGHYIRVTPTGAISFWTVARDPNGKQIWKLVGSPPMSIADAREKAMAMIRSIRSTVLTEAQGAATFEGIAGAWFERHVIKEHLRSQDTIRGLLKNHIYPAFAGMNFVDVRRNHIIALLDRVEDGSGSRSADYVLSTISSICQWYAMRDENYSSPIIRGMKRVKKGDRDRILNDHEIAALWATDGLFGNFTKFALMTAQRKEKIATMRWSDIRDGVWTIPAEAREKGNAEALRLPQLALDVLEDQRRINAASPFAFADGYSPRSKLARQKAAFEARVALPHWTLHDLRRTARSLMAAAGVTTLHAEMVMGHKQRGVVGIYDRHDYLDEKADALLRLANRIRDIVTPPPSNVEKLCKRA